MIVVTLFNGDQNVCIEHGFLLKLLTLPPQILMSWKGLTPPIMFQALGQVFLLLVKCCQNKKIKIKIKS